MQVKCKECGKNVSSYDTLLGMDLVCVEKKIKQLQEELGSLKAEKGMADMGFVSEGAQKEIEQLKAKNKKQEKLIVVFKEEILRRVDKNVQIICLRSEIEQLKVENEKLREIFADYPEMMERLTKNAKQIQAELKTALLEIELIKHINRWIPVSEPPTKLHEESSGYGGVWQISDAVWVLYPKSKTIGFARYTNTEKWTGTKCEKFTHWKLIILPKGGE